MRVQILSPYPETLAETVLRNGAVIVNDNPDWIVSYGHREILRGEILTRYASRIVNLHISYLPWNRGSDPNFWSWFDHTPKGVSLHFIDAGLDTGPIIAQREVKFTADDTLATSYQKLRAAAVDLLSEVWPSLITGDIIAVPQIKGTGSYHRAADKTQTMARFPLGFDTPCSEIEAAGAINVP